MFYNYMIVALRNLLRHKMYTLINVGGLAVGLASCLMIVLMIKDHTGYEKWVENADNIVGIQMRFVQEGGVQFYGFDATSPLKADMQDKMSGFKAVARSADTNRTILKDGQPFLEYGSNVDPEFFDIFNLTLLRGEAKLPDLASVLLSETMARKYFNSIDVVGKTLNFGSAGDVQVRGVFKDFPRQSLMKYDFFRLFDETSSPYYNWSSYNVRVFAELAPDFSESQFRAEQVPIINEKMSDWTEDGVDASEIISFKAFPLLDIHLKEKSSPDESDKMSQMVIFGIVAILILVVASLNFINLTTVRAITRIQEVSLRKVLGADKKQIMSQFLSETFLVALIAMFFALTIIELTLPAYNDFLGTDFSMSIFLELELFAGIIALLLIVGVGAGAYPAFYVSGMRPSTYLRSNKSAAGSAGANKFRTLLVTLQYSIAIGLSIAAIVITTQTEYAKTMDSGLDKNGLIGISWVQDRKDAGFFKRIALAIDAMPNVEAVTSSFNLPTDTWNSNRDAKLLEGEDISRETPLEINAVDFGYFEAYKIDMAAGRTFNEKYSSDTLPTDPNVTKGDATDDDPYRDANVIINETAAKDLGFLNPKDAVGKTIRMQIGYGVGNANFTIVGVTRDFNYDSARSKVHGEIYYRHVPSLRHITVRYRSGQEASVNKAIEALWRAEAPSRLLSKSSIADRYENLYRNENRQMTLFTTFSVLAVIIASLGLYALTFFTAERRTKEIGIRKVLGAQTADIIKLLSFQTVKPVLIATIIALPIVHYFMGEWMANFEFRMSSSLYWSLITGVGFGALILAWITVIGHAVKVARAHAIVALRYE